MIVWSLWHCSSLRPEHTYFIGVANKLQRGSGGAEGDQLAVWVAAQVPRVMILEYISVDSLIISRDAVEEMKQQADNVALLGGTPFAYCCLNSPDCREQPLLKMSDPTLECEPEFVMLSEGGSQGTPLGAATAPEMVGVHLSKGCWTAGPCMLGSVLRKIS